MPLYEFVCHKCSNDKIEKVWRLLVPIKERDKKILCPKCKGVLKREISACDYIIK